MPIRYAGLPDDLVVAATPLGDDGGSDGWWAGVARCMVMVGIASTLAANALAAQISPSSSALPWGPDQAEIEKVPAAQFSDEVWINPVPAQPFTFTVPGPAQWSFEQNERVLPGQFEDDSWIHPVAPIDLSFVVPPQWSYETNDRVRPGQFEDDSWLAYTPPIPFVPPTPLSFAVPSQWGYEQNQIVPSGAFVPTDEDAIPIRTIWPNELSPKAFTADDDYYALPIEELGWVPPLVWPSNSFAPNFGIDDVVGVPLPQFEDDAWLTLVPSTPFSFLVPSQWVYEQNDRVTVVIAPVFEDDSAPSLVLPSSLSFGRLTTFAQDELIAQLEDGEWQSFVTPTPMGFGRLFLFPQEEYIAQLEDSEWSSLVAPLPMAFGRLVLFLQDDALPQLYVTEGEWRNLVAPELFRFVRQGLGWFGVASDEAVGPLTGTMWVNTGRLDATTPIFILTVAAPRAIISHTSTVERVTPTAVSAVITPLEDAT